MTELKLKFTGAFLSADALIYDANAEEINNDNSLFIGFSDCIVACRSYIDACLSCDENPDDYIAESTAEHKHAIWCKFGDDVDAESLESVLELLEIKERAIYDTARS